jgi:hypothetical protein
MKRTGIFILLMLVATVVGAGPERRGGGARHSLLAPGRLAEFLSLSEAQVEQAKALRATMRETVAPLREQLRAKPEAENARELREQIKAAAGAFESSFTAMLDADQKARWTVYREIAQMRRR